MTQPIWITAIHFTWDCPWRVLRLQLCSAICSSVGVYEWHRWHFCSMSCTGCAIQGTSSSWLWIIQGTVSPIASTCPVSSGKWGVFQDLFTKECHLAAPQRRPFCAMAHALWNVIFPLSLIRFAPTLMAFRKVLKTCFAIKPGVLIMWLSSLFGYIDWEVFDYAVLCCLCFCSVFVSL